MQEHAILYQFVIIWYPLLAILLGKIPLFPTVSREMNTVMEMKHPAVKSVIIPSQYKNRTNDRNRITKALSV